MGAARRGRIRRGAVHSARLTRRGFLGTAAATGTLIARLDADDVALPHRIGRQVEYLKTHPEIQHLFVCQVIDFSITLKKDKGKGKQYIC